MRHNVAPFCIKFLFDLNLITLNSKQLKYQFNPTRGKNSPACRVETLYLQLNG